MTGLATHNMVFDKEWFKQNNDRLCWLANAPVIKYWFRWLLRIHNDIPFGATINKITPNSFTYNGKKVGDELEITTDFRTHEKFGKRLYYGLKPLWYILHFWDWSTQIQPVLNCGFDTLTEYPQAGGGGANTTCDGMIQYNDSASWATARGAAAGDSAYTNINPDFTSASYVDTLYYIIRAFQSFDTSSLSSTATITDAKYYLSGDGTTEEGTVSMHIVSSSQANANTLVVGDFDEIGSTSFGEYTSWDETDGTYNEKSLNASGISNISKTGISKFGIRQGKDYSNTQPSETNKIKFRSADNTGTTKDPKLVVTYTAAVGPANVKTYKGLAAASVKTCKGLAIASVKTKKGLN